jgi:membrane-associated phospholipid phosphatase
MRLLLRELEKNRLFIWLFAIFFVLGFILIFLTEKEDPLIFWNEFRGPNLNLFFRAATLLGEPWTYGILFFIMLFIRYRFAIVIILTGLLATLLAGVLKIFFSHPRPILYLRNEGILDQIVIVDNIQLYEGMTSFPSGHTLAGFALFTVSVFMLERKGWWVEAIFFFMALLVAISRVYLLHHFLPDVIFGAICGLSLGIGMHLVQLKVADRTGRLSENLSQYFERRRRYPRSNE